MLFIIAGTIAAALYGNIGIKVLYNNVLMEFCNAPPLTTKSGKILWAAIVPVYWSIAFIVAAGEVIRHDTGMKRYIRGFMAKHWYENVWLVIYTLGALVVSGLGSYSAIEGLIAAFKTPQVNAFTCVSPLNPNA